jgi:hypothetical protein
MGGTSARQIVNRIATLFICGSLLGNKSGVRYFKYRYRVDTNLGCKEPYAQTKTSEAVEAAARKAGL